MKDSLILIACIIGLYAIGIVFHYIKTEIELYLIELEYRKKKKEILRERQHYITHKEK